VLTQTYQFYIKKCADSDWACAGTHVIEWPTVYLTFQAPVDPWGTKYNAQGQPVATRTCWVEALHRACTYMPEAGYTSSQERAAMGRLVDSIYYSGKRYDPAHDSEYHYEASTDNMRFDLVDVLPAAVGDCQDFSLYWEKLNHSLGLNVYARRVNGLFRTKNVLPANSQSGWVAFDFNFHHVGWDDDVFDPCVKLNQPDPLLAKDMNANTYKGYLWDSGAWNWLDDWKLGGTDPYFASDTEVD